MDATVEGKVVGVLTPSYTVTPIHRRYGAVSIWSQLGCGVLVSIERRQPRQTEPYKDSPMSSFGCKPWRRQHGLLESCTARDGGYSGWGRQGKGGG